MLYSCRVHAGRVHRHRCDRRDLRHLAVPQRRRPGRARDGLDEEVGRAPRRPRQLPVRPRVLHLRVRRRRSAALFLAAQVRIGDPNVGLSFTLTSIAAAVLGGASLLGGRGSFIGAVVGALFLNVIINILPFLGWSASYGRIMVGCADAASRCPSTRHPSCCCARRPSSPTSACRRSRSRALADEA